MKVLILADSNSPHIIKWTRALAERGLEITIFSLTRADRSVYSNYSNIHIESFDFDYDKAGKIGASFSKIKYFLCLPVLKRIIDSVQPDILHAHYASSYGAIGALTGFHPYVISVWGSDVYYFPRKTFLHNRFLKFNLKRADAILSTSHAMAEETRRYTNKNIVVTPFGIDTENFKKQRVTGQFDKDEIVIGTIKSLKEIYGIDCLIKAFDILCRKYPVKKMKLLIVGGGPQEKHLKELSDSLGLSSKIIFTGGVPYDRVVDYHNMISIFVAVSRRESFGVAVLEASSCEVPVVVSNVGGLPEVVEDGITGYIVPPRNPERTADVIERLLLDKELRLNMGKAGRKRVERLYNWNENVEQMIDIYKNLLTN